MATRMTLPLLGQTMEEGTITKWLKKEGDKVEKGEPLLEVMTDKANMEVEAPESGVLLKIVASENAIVPVHDMIAVIGNPGEPIDELLEKPSSTAPTAVTVELTSAPAVGSAPAVAAQSSSKPSDGKVIASPRAKKIASEKGLDISLLSGKGTGPGGRIVEKDIISYLANVPVAPRVTSLAGKVAADMGVELSSLTGTGLGGKVTRNDVLRSMTSKPQRPSIARTIPLTGIRKIVADNIAMSIRTAPHVTLVSEVDVTSVLAMRKQIVPEFEKRFGVKLTVTALIIKAVALAILDNPIINASLTDDSIVIHDAVNVGVAAAIEGGLVVPVVKDADVKSLAEISAEIAELAGKARTGNLSLDEMQGGTFTVSNLGTYGVDSFNPVINPPQSAILGVCRTVEKPVILDGQVQARSMMNLCLSFDHRVMDGAPAAQYLARVKELLESPYLLLL